MSKCTHPLLLIDSNFFVDAPECPTTSAAAIGSRLILTFIDWAEKISFDIVDQKR